MMLSEISQQEPETLQEVISRLFSRFEYLITSERLETPDCFLVDSAKKRKFFPDNFQELTDIYKQKLDTLGDIVQVDNKFKRFYTFKKSFFVATPYHICVDEYHDTISNISYGILPQDNSVTSGEILIRFKLKNGEKYFFFVRQDPHKQVLNLLNLILCNIPEICIEQRYRSHIRKTLPPLSKDYWGAKKNKEEEWENLGQGYHHNFYVTVVILS